MALLTMIRHGQASFLSDNYDKLSKLGELQSRMLGSYWVRTGVVFDQVYSGPAQRQIRTAHFTGEAYRQAGLAWPEPVIVPEFDEYPGMEVMRIFLPQLVEKHEDIRELEAQFLAAREKTGAARVYDRLFQRVTRMWAAGHLECSEVGSWEGFCGGVARGVMRIRAAAANGSRIAVFTSGGVIAAAVRIALDLSAEKTLEVSWASRNAAFADFLFSADRFSLNTFNNLPHIEDPALTTMR